MNLFIKQLFYILSAVSIFMCSAALGASITQEKNCMFLLDTGEYAVGDQLLVYRETGGKKSRLAVIQVTKKNAAGKAIAKLVRKGTLECSALVGSLVEPYTASKKDVKADVRQPGLQGSVSLMLGMGTIAQDGIAEANFYPDVLQPKTNQPSIKTSGLIFTAQTYPLMLAGSSGFLAELLGVEAGLRYVTTFVKWEVPGENEKIGSGASNSMDFWSGLAFRFLYGGRKMATELIVSYLNYSLSHSFSGEVSLLSPGDLPMGFKYSGLAAGLRQRIEFPKTFAASLSFFYGLLGKGAVEWAEGSPQKASPLEGKLPPVDVTVSKTSGFWGDVLLAYPFDNLWVGGSFQYHFWSADMQSVTQTDAKETLVNFKDIQMFFGLGVVFRY